MRTRMVTMVSMLVFNVACGRTELDPPTPSSGFGGSSVSSSLPGAGGSSGPGGMGGGPDTTASTPRSTDPSCPPGPPDAARLLAYDKDWHIGALASSGEDLFIASTFSYDLSTRGRVVRLALGSLTMDTHEFKGTPLGLGYQARTVIYKPSLYNPSDPFGYYSQTVVLWELSSGQETNLPNPEGFKSATSRALTGNSKGEVFWGPSDGSMGLAKWDPRTGKTEALLKNREVLVLLADETTIYWQEPKDGKYAYPYRTALYAMPIKGGTPSLLLDMPMKSWMTPALLALDDERLYYLDPALGVVSMTKQGGDKQSVLPMATPLWLDSSTIDGTDIYWVASTDPNTLRRTPKHGGQTQTLWTAKDRPIQALGADACKVYWAISNPQEIYFRSK